MHRSVTLGAFFVLLANCSSTTGGPLGDDAGSDGRAPTEASTTLDAGVDGAGDCRPKGASCADDLFACCSRSCLGTVDGSECD